MSKNQEVYRIEKIIRKRGDMSLVKWFGYLSRSRTNQFISTTHWFGTGCLILLSYGLVEKLTSLLSS